MWWLEEDRLLEMQGEGAYRITPCPLAPRLPLGHAWYEASREFYIRLTSGLGSILLLRHSDPRPWTVAAGKAAFITGPCRDYAHRIQGNRVRRPTGRQLPEYPGDR